MRPNKVDTVVSRRANIFVYIVSESHQCCLIIGKKMKGKGWTETKRSRTTTQGFVKLLKKQHEIQVISNTYTVFSNHLDHENKKWPRLQHATKVTYPISSTVVNILGKLSLNGQFQFAFFGDCFMCIIQLNF